MPTTIRNRLLLMGMACVVLAAGLSPAWAQEIEFATAAKLEKVLQEESPISFSGQPLIDALDSIQETYGVCIFLDRRVDPTQKLAVSTPNETLRNRLQILANSVEIEAAFLDWGVYLGPPETAAKIATLTRKRILETKELDRTAQRRLLAKRPLSWPRVSQPKQITESLADRYGVRVSGVAGMPFDVWRERQFPDMDFCSAMVLLLAGFDSTFEWLESGRSARVVPIPSTVSVTDSYRLPRGRTPPTSEWKEAFPNAEITANNREIEVTGSAELHDLVDAWVSGRSTRPTRPPTTEKSLTLRIGAATLEQATDYLAEQLEIEFQFDAKSRSRLGEQIAVDVKDASLEELLKELLTPLELSFKLNGSTVVVTAE